MREKAQLWITVSNREESMARALSRSGYNEGAVLHAHRAAGMALIAVFAERGWAHTSDRCADLCLMLKAHDITATAEVRRAAEVLDRHAEKADPGRSGRPPAQVCDAEVAAECLGAVKVVRGFVNTVLTR